MRTSFSFETPLRWRELSIPFALCALTQACAPPSTSFEDESPPIAQAVFAQSSAPTISLSRRTPTQGLSIVRGEPHQGVDGTCAPDPDAPGSDWSPSQPRDCEDPPNSGCSMTPGDVAINLRGRVLLVIVLILAWIKRRAAHH